VSGIESFSGIVFVLLSITISLPVMLVVSFLYIIYWAFLKFTIFFVLGTLLLLCYVAILLLRNRAHHKSEIYNLLKKAIYAAILLLVLPGVAWLTFRVFKSAASQVEFFIGIVFAILTFLLLLPVIALMAVSYLLAEMLFEIDNPWLQLFVIMAGIWSIITLFKRVKISVAIRGKKLEMVFMLREDNDLTA